MEGEGGRREGNQGRGKTVVGSGRSFCNAERQGLRATAVSGPGPGVRAQNGGDLSVPSPTHERNVCKRALFMSAG